ncbi:MAG: flavodoxin domain-containing protein, partial [Muribaculaceae bacterium]|nr:flavodoxin domain-containing protein [Muribaculaceae bacterium]
MIYYFSGTRNSRYAASRIGSLIEEDVRFIPALDAYAETIDLSQDDSVGFVFPVYAWGVPPIVMDFIRRLPEAFVQAVRNGNLPVWCVATCGDETGMAVKMLRKELARRDLELSGAWSLIMPNVYVLLPGFGTDPNELEVRKVTEAVGGITHNAGG